MNADVKSTGKTLREAPAEKTEKPDVAIADFATLLHRGIERLVGLQKATLDVVSHQTTDVSSTLKNSLEPLTPPAGTMLLDVTEQAVDGWVDAQKHILDLIVEQSAQAVEAAKESGISASNSMALLGELMQQSTERAVAAQKTILDFAAKQNKAASELIQKQTGLAGTPAAALADAFERGVTMLIDTQKEFLETAAKLAKTATSVKG
jgi:hypothetical protein